MCIRHIVYVASTTISGTQSEIVYVEWIANYAMFSMGNEGKRCVKNQICSRK